MSQASNPEPAWSRFVRNHIGFFDRNFRYNRTLYGLLPWMFAKEFEFPLYLTTCRLAGRRRLFVLTTHGVYLFPPMVPIRGVGQGFTKATIISGSAIQQAVRNIGKRDIDLHVKETDARDVTKYEVTALARIEDSAVISGMISVIARERAWCQPRVITERHPNLLSDALAASVELDVRDARDWLERRLESIRPPP